ncbi:hypothetical protein [Saccharibacillus alkalitolerans]|uniref:Uncharacterized protein n=1 Tax=Saccharibacillus alkalitolerans TaxID=2705290 RepID=A0ABX0F416_9BACL|nr:hypothetical protein [Saccharibacillus alkalitolerans]NGZ75230.1 hypothetical protein [Saccharibacillus alkalitolerans]
MKRKQAVPGLLSAACIAMTVGCGGEREEKFEPNVFSERDMCIVKAEETGSRVCYGMEREEAEKAVGALVGEEKPGGIAYEEGVRLTYRENKVVGMDLLEDSRGRYQTARGAQVGMSREELVKLYGDRYMKPESPGMLVYYYDSRTKELLTEANPEMMKGGMDEAQDWYTASVILRADDKAEFISLMDRRRAVYMN